MSREKFARIYAETLKDEDVASLSDAAFRMWVMGLVRSVDSNTLGKVRIGRPGIVAGWSSIEGGPESVAKAVDELCEKSFWVRDLDNPNEVTIRNFLKFQTPSTEAENPETWLEPKPTNTSSGVRGISAELLEVTRAYLEDSETYPEALDAYRQSLKDAVMLAAIHDGYEWNDAVSPAEAVRLAYPSVKEGKTYRYLVGQLLLSALGYVYRGDVPASSMPRLARHARLSSYGEYWVLAAIFDAASRDVSGDPTSYIIAVAKSKAAEWKGNRS